MGSIKQVLENLVADDKVSSERIGSSTYYWTFPGDKMIKKNRKLNEELNTLKQSIDKLESDIKIEQEDKEDTEERKKLEENLQQVDEQLIINEEKLNKVQTYGPVAMDRLINQKKQIDNEMYHYIEQIQIIKGYLKKNMPGVYNENQFNNQFEVDPEWDEY